MLNKHGINIQHLHSVTGVCEDLMKASSAASAPSLSQLMFILHIAAYAAINTLRELLSR